MEREYKEIVTPVGNHKVRIKTWLTGRERRAIRGIIFENVNLSSELLEGKEEDIKPKYELGAEVIQKMQDKAFESIIEEIDGNKEDIVNRVLNMHEKDYDFIVKEIDKVTQSLSEDSKKK